MLPAHRSRRSTPRSRRLFQRPRSAADAALQRCLRQSELSFLPARARRVEGRTDRYFCRATAGRCRASLMLSAYDAFPARGVHLVRVVDLVTAPAIALIVARLAGTKTLRRLICW